MWTRLKKPWWQFCSPYERALRSVGPGLRRRDHGVRALVPATASASLPPATRGEDSAGLSPPKKPHSPLQHTARACVRGEEGYPGERGARAALRGRP